VEMIPTSYSIHSDNGECLIASMTLYLPGK